jgi:hypothetical protein
VGDGRPAPAPTLPGDCCGLPSWARLGRLLGRPLGCRTDPNGRNIDTLVGVGFTHYHDLNSLPRRACGSSRTSTAGAEFDQTSLTIVKNELAGDGRPAPAALPGDCYGLSSPTRSPDGSERPKTDRFGVIFGPGNRRPAVRHADPTVEAGQRGGICAEVHRADHVNTRQRPGTHAAPEAL